MARNEKGPTIQKEFENEFATVEVRNVYTRNGERLEISSPKLGTKIQFDPLALESLTWQDNSLISKLLEDPFGPQTPAE